MCSSDPEILTVPLCGSVNLSDALDRTCVDYVAYHYIVVLLFFKNITIYKWGTDRRGVKWIKWSTLLVLLVLNKGSFDL